MNSQFINHVTDIDNATAVSATLGGVTAEFNVTKMTASMDYALTIGDDDMVISVTDAKMTTAGNANGYIINVPSATTSDGHQVTGMQVYIDMNMNNENLCHWAKATIDGKYQLNALVPVIAFYNAYCNVTRVNGMTVPDATGNFTFTVSNITTEHRSASLAITGITGIEPFYSGITYPGLNVVTTDDGLHIYSDTKIAGKERTEYALNSIDAYINFATHTLTADLDIDNSAQLKVSAQF